MRALVTGSNGFVGAYLCELLEKKGYTVFGTSFSGTTYDADITNKKEIAKVVDMAKPDVVFHLAAQSSVRMSWEKKKETFRINVNGTRNVLEAAKKFKPRILVVSSSEVYGKPKKNPIPEKHPLQPVSPYAESKAEQEKIASDHGAVIARSFPHTGPGQLPSFVIPDFAKQIADIEKGKEAVISVGNLDVVRDFSDVRDIVKAYVLLAEKGKGTYNVCSGRGIRLRDALDMMISHSTKKIRVEIDKGKLRKADIPKAVGDNTRIRKLGWKNSISFEQTLADVVDYWRGV